ncbi:MAG TPA: thioredoxin family protein [Candidatus Cloacimonas sp.]|nr:thioredoxin family protein [Candidatus Cloacimonas sp.]
MKWTIIIILVFAVSFLGCTPAPKPEPTQEQAPTPSFDEAMDSPKAYNGEWLTDFSKAQELAKELNRPILVNFTGSDWCSWCIKLTKEVFSKEAFVSYATDSLVLLKLDFPRKIPQTPEVKAANEKLAKDFGVQGFPTIVLLDTNGKEINRTGYQPGGAEAYVKHLQDLLAGK